MKRVPRREAAEAGAASAADEAGTAAADGAAPVAAVATEPGSRMRPAERPGADGNKPIDNGLAGRGTRSAATLGEVRPAAEPIAGQGLRACRNRATTKRATPSTG